MSLKPSELELIKQRLPLSASTLARNPNVAHSLPNPEPEHAPVVPRHPQHHPGKEKGEGRSRVVIESRRNRLCDADNLYCKAILDAVRYAGLIVDDSPEHIELVVRQTKVKKKDEETIVTIERLPEISPTDAAAYYAQKYAEVIAENQDKQR